LPAGLGFTAMRRSALLIFLTASAWAAESELPEVRSKADVVRHFSPSARLHVVNLWATWCVPCVAEMPDLQKVDNAFADTAVEFIGVSMDSAIPGPTPARKALVKKFLTSRNIKFKILYYLGKPSRIANEYDFSGELPLTVVYDHSGKELIRYTGVINRAKLTKDLESFLKKEKQ
jgi:thiol-disulfide isomerase/thioredoxin